MFWRGTFFMLTLRELSAWPCARSKHLEGLIKGLVVVYTYICRCIGIGMFVVFSGSKWSLRKHEFIIRVYFRSVFSYTSCMTVPQQNLIFIQILFIYVSQKRDILFFFIRDENMLGSKTLRNIVYSAIFKGCYCYLQGIKINVSATNFWKKTV